MKIETIRKLGEACAAERWYIANGYGPHEPAAVVDAFEGACEDGLSASVTEMPESGPYRMCKALLSIVRLAYEEGRMPSIANSERAMKEVTEMYAVAIVRRFFGDDLQPDKPRTSEASPASEASP